MEITRTQRFSDGTVSIEGHRFEVPSQFGYLGVEKIDDEFAPREEN
jgi:hypothetical protein